MRDKVVAGIGDPGPSSLVSDTGISDAGYNGTRE
jgi:hypothetical protein